MKFTSALATLFASVAVATPTPTVDNVADKPHLVKRASISDKATLGYATLNGGTSGGAGGTVTTVSSLAEFTAAVNEKDTAAKIVVVKGVIKGTANVRIGSNKSVIGLPGAGFDGIGLHARRQSNIIVRNIKSTNVLASTGDGLKIEQSTNVWVDHCEFSSALVSDKDYYDGLVDASHAADYMTISYTYFHDHWKTSLVGHSENNGDEDKGHLRITYAHNYWANFGSRGPSLRFGTGHIYNSYYLNGNSGINTRQGAQVLIQSNVFKNVSVPITTQDSDIVGYAVAIDNDLGGAANTAPVGTMNANSPGYSYSLLGSANVVATVPGQAGQKLTF
ncbi:putative pectate lyase A [Colletotrichum fructicola]|uniref:pectate lyase n=3 Tax=Colletotrichum gloeosporioides species complex TaxID=2707338 RepID=L2FQ42_COLFN|nr:putative pectate lyase A [Colletotrichum fructicola]XP_036501339.1 putative pectate lyase A [Colletotrichum siamense]AUT30983.1 pectate lyase A [Colletotrichum gloeosporioides]KAF0324410.1 pectate lyase a [Colletotrichum asianum]KAF4492778.1 putative pectate lyase A [Colletotrichum fructicola Nara gc5]KAI8186991.1 putative pectate lyase A [Colletotrichum sp. SAR 10_65]KAI8223054.1 putative pectate lyase A [Colletotrichum sp. SAR 10_77]KAI8232656.1 putative pectate lyase A [Colletotrichum 